MRALGATIASAVVAMFAAASVASAEGQIADIRFGKQPEFDRIVVDLSADPVDASQSSTDGQFVLELSAAKPQLSLEKEDKLADLKIFLQDSGTGTRMVITKNNRPVQVFRIVAAPGSGKGDRLVLDIGRAGGRLAGIPADAARVPEGGGRAVAAAQPPPPPEPVAVAPEPPPVSVQPPPPPRQEPKPAPKPEKRPEEDLLGGVAPRTAAAPRTETKPAPAPAPAPSEATTASKDDQGSGDAPDEDVWVLVRSIDIQGVTGTSPSVQDLNELKLAVSPVRGGYVAPRDNRPVQRLPLRALVGDDRNGRRLSGSVLQLIVETIAAEYTRNEKLGTRVDIRRADLEGLMQGGDGRLVIRVREMPARASGSQEN